jgi:hypothetical protein
MRTRLLMLITALMLASTSTSFASPFGNRIRPGEGIVPPPTRGAEPLWLSSHTPRPTFVQPPPKTFAEALGARDQHAAVR